ncbi:type IV pilus modification protein PilV [Amphritea balenae]|uniref:Type IV pilus modification protein PilV n=1 Tax=Amphritea balenae TaxID=452629 RepID=A0A3P1SNT0_9GAMM|nr:type IV pilus modification protein PilV [Amphritea balenae]RRC98787.1 type IV pilus modification protein PilV [Amphritea balenae]GGK61698.1 type IV pilus modification protein PilV [Amphritea balenae]
MQRQLGFNLIEVMVALVILTIGLLGMAALQLTAVKQNQSAYMRTQANQLAYDIIDRVRVNKGALSGYLDQDEGTENSNCISYNGNVSGCSEDEMAANDLYEWLQLLNQKVPSGSGRLCQGTLTFNALNMPGCNSDDDAPLSVYIWWEDSRDGSSTRLVMSSRL